MKSIKVYICPNALYILEDDKSPICAVVQNQYNLDDSFFNPNRELVECLLVPMKTIGGVNKKYFEDTPPIDFSYLKTWKKFKAMFKKVGK